MASSSWDAGRVRRQGRIHALARLVRIEHTLFSLPFAYAGALLSGYSFTLRDAVLMALAVLGLRTAGMAYNNIADLDIDRVNPRTRGRPLVTGAVSMREAWALVAAGTILFIASAAMLNIYALAFSPLLLALTLTYPHAKRIHSIPHIHLGLVLGSVIFGGAVAASGDEARSLGEVLDSVPWLYVAAVALWVAGFDTIYSIMDMDFDKRHGLGSLPARLGRKGALLAAGLMHMLSAALFLAGVRVYGLGPAGAASMAVGAILLGVQHPLAWRGRIPQAFNINLVLPLIVSLGIIVDKMI
ncbi:MAG: putative 4-hydroxybenzoate polyprenyltransferase [Desulfurococcales archaeon]|nr:putative 4-hydroxybenzoate polyprenyltransferase [Desulfurococcales archaeon]